jgi:hypothetical protein
MQKLSPLLRLIQARSSQSQSDTPFTTAIVDTLGSLQGELSGELVQELMALLSRTCSESRVLRRQLSK